MAQRGEPSGSQGQRRGPTPSARVASVSVAAATSDVLVAGGGIGGLSAALSLARAGQHVRLLERERQFSEVGAGLQMAPNATRILRAWEVLDRAMASGVSARRLVFRDALTGEMLTYLDLADVERRYGAPYFVMHRHDLLTSLVDACVEAGVELLAGTPVDSVESTDRFATARSGEREFRASVLVAADGGNSTLRRHFSDDQPVPSGYVAYRGALPMHELPFPVSEDMATSVVAYLGPARHLVQYPLRRGQMFNTVAVFRSPAFLRGEARWGLPEELDGAFEGSCDAVQRGLSSLWRDRQWLMHDREPIDTWVHRRIVLLGDAAHPMLQYLAQGACQAVQDAAHLADAASRYRTSGGVDWDAALADYQAVRTTHTARVQRTARDWGEFWHVDGFSARFRNQLLRDRDPFDYRHIDWLYGK